MWVVEEVKCCMLGMGDGQGFNLSSFNITFVLKPPGGLQGFLQRAAGPGWTIFAVVPLQLPIGVDPAQKA